MTRVGSGFDVHPFATDDRPLTIGGVVVPNTPGLEGHSDGDVALHALADALLGAAALGDLGERFGSDRPEHAGADSSKFLADVKAAVIAMGFEIGNVDLTVVAQEPRLAPHRDAMRRAIAETLQIVDDRVSVKFTTTDRLGSIGRGEGIAAWAVCSLDEVGMTGGKPDVATTGLLGGRLGGGGLLGGRQ